MTGKRNQKNVNDVTLSSDDDDDYTHKDPYGNFSHITECFEKSLKTAKSYKDNIEDKIIKIFNTMQENFKDLNDKMDDIVKKNNENVELIQENLRILLHNKDENDVIDINAKMLEQAIIKIDKFETKIEENSNINEIKGIKSKIDNIANNFHLMCNESIQKTEEKNSKIEEKNEKLIKGLEKQNKNLVDRITKFNKEEWKTKFTVQNFKNVNSVQENLNVTDSTKFIVQNLQDEDVKFFNCYQCENKFNMLNLLMTHRKKMHKTRTRCRNVNKCKYYENCWFSHESEDKESVISYNTI